MDANVGQRHIRSYIIEVKCVIREVALIRCRGYALWPHTSFTAIAMICNIHASYINIGCALKAEYVLSSIAAVDVSLGRIRRAIGIVDAQNFGVRAGCPAEGRWSARTVRVAGNSQGPIPCIRVGGSDTAIIGAVDQVGIATCANPSPLWCSLCRAVGPAAVRPQIANVAEGAVLIDSRAGIGRRGLAVALAAGHVDRVARSACGVDVPGRRKCWNRAEQK